jgi:hypothetical protein
MHKLVLGTTLSLLAFAATSEPPTITSQTKKSEQPALIVHKTESCGCCIGWVRRMEAAGFRVEVHNENKMDQIKRALGVPANLESCHTAKIDRYFIEGHVPAEDIKRLLAEHPNAMGLAVPKMPIGSPGMEEGSHHDPYDVLLVQRSGKTSVFAHHGD